MLTIKLKDLELYDDEKGFDTLVGETINLEYSLRSIYEWEALYKKPFLGRQLTDTEFNDFILLMSDKKFDINQLTIEDYKLISDYIADSQTATKFSNQGQNGGKINRNKVQTAEEIYAIMFTNSIPLDWEDRNLNRLLTIIRIISEKSQPPKKMTREEIIAQNKELNRQRKEKLKTRG